jgi:hypothetical protein
VTTPAPSTNLEAALEYLGRGWAVVPAGERSKRPAVRWKLFEDGAPSEEQVRKWFAHWPGANVCVVTGRVSNLVVLDVDPKHGGDASLAELEARFGPLPDTVEAVTGGGGRHLYFAHPGPETRNRAALMPGVDLRGDGGVVVAPPSIHPSGKAYRWLEGHSPREMAAARMPAWLLEPELASDGRLGHPAAYWRRLAREGVAEGRRNTSIASFTGHLLWRNVDPDVIMELMLAWNRARCQPPLSDDEVIQTVLSIERTHGGTAEASGQG